MKTSKIIVSIATTLILIQLSCTDFLDVKPEDVLLKEEALVNQEDVVKLLNSTYTVLFSSSFLGGRSQIVSELLTENILGSGLDGDWSAIYNRSTSVFEVIKNNLYAEPYKAIYRSNVVLEKLSLIQDENLLKEVEGSALFVRALAHFETVRLFAQPYGFTPDNSHLGIPIKKISAPQSAQRATVNEVYNFIIEDLKKAEELLPLVNDLYYDQNGAYPTKWAAKALLARVYFQMNDFTNAYLYANDVIENSTYMFDTDLVNFYAYSDVKARGTGEIDDPLNVKALLETTSIDRVWTQGYIVGTIDANVIPNIVSFTEPFSVNVNVLIADNPDETNVVKCCVIDLPAGEIRQQLNLVTNPTNFKKLIKISGLKATSSDNISINNIDLFTFYDDLIIPRDYKIRYSTGGSSEAIFKSISFSVNSTGTIDYTNRGGDFSGLLRSDTKVPYFKLTQNAYNYGLSDPTDLRGQAWYGTKDGFNVINKFNYDELSVSILTITELKLIRAESAAENSSNISVAQQDIQDIFDRAYGVGLRVAPSTSTAIIQEARTQRRLEFIFEGHRGQDLKRIGALGRESVTIRNAPWNCPGSILQFPQSEISLSPGFIGNPEGGC